MLGSNPSATATIRHGELIKGSPFSCRWSKALNPAGQRPETLARLPASQTSPCVHVSIQPCFRKTCYRYIRTRGIRSESTLFQAIHRSSCPRQALGLNRIKTEGLLFNQHCPTIFQHLPCYGRFGDITAFGCRYSII